MFDLLCLGWKQRRAGAMPLENPKLRRGSYFPDSWSRRRAQKALTGVIQQRYVQGISTHSMDELLKALGMDQKWSPRPVQPLVRLSYLRAPCEPGATMLA
jgi:transposase-like protein